MARYKKPNLITKIKLFLYRKKYKKKTQWLKRVFVVALWLFIIGCIGILAVFAYYSKDIPNPNKLAQRQVTQSTKIYDRTGETLLYDIHGEEKRTVVDFEQIPQYMKDATIVIEDDDFYHHFGLDFKGILRAFFANLKGKQILQGGSTITQQFVKNAILSPERTLTRKIKEAILAIELEIKYSKDQILDFYLNQVPYGSNAYGVEAAAITFFNKHVYELSLAESTLLAALPKAPTYYSPYGSHPEQLKARQEHILDRMVEFGYISSEKAEQAKQENLEFAEKTEGIKAPHFVMYIREYLDERYGRNFIEKKGLKVYTTIDWELQQLAEQVVLEISEKNKKNHNAHNASLVAIDPKTNQILAMVGSKNYFGEPSPKNCIPGKTCLFDPNVNVSIRLRQPGSSFKPFAYAAAFKKGYTPETIIFDLKTEFSSPGTRSYKPRNYDEKFRGPVTFRQALAQSLNIPAVKVLYLAGVKQTINIAEDLGITSLKDRSRYGLSLVLGGGEVTLLEETAAFAVFASEGLKNYSSPASIIKIENQEGEILEEYQKQAVRVLDEQIARLVTDILSDNQARAPMFGEHSNLYLGERPAAAKTGTTQEYRDGWTVGYTPSLAVGVWAGNNHPISMPRGSGAAIAAPIWNKFMTQAYEIKSTNEQQTEIENSFWLPKEIEYFTEPKSIQTDKPILNGNFANEIKVEIDKISGKLATEYTPPELIEEKIYREVHCILYYLNKDNPQGEGNSREDPQFNNWEPPVIKWALSSGREEEYNTPPPQEYDDVHSKKTWPSVEIRDPKNNEKIKNETIKIRAYAKAPLGFEQIDFFFDNQLIGTDRTEPYQIYYSIPEDVKSGEHQITVKVYDKYGAQQIDMITIFKY